MRVIFRLILLFLFLVLLALVGAVFLAVDDQPRVHRTAEVTPANIERARRILDRNDPRKLQSGVRRTITLSQQDFDLAANYLANRYAWGSARVVLSDGSILVNASTELPSNPIGRYVNVEALLTESDSLLRIDRLHVGRLWLPAWVANRFVVRGIGRLLENEDYGFAADVIRKVSVADGQLAITYEWQADLPDRLHRVIVTREDQERFRVYHARLAEESHSLQAKNVSLTELMIPLFALSQERSRGGDPIAENRAVILVLTAYVNDMGLERIVPAAKDWPRPTSRTMTLKRRDDFAKHFIVSAAIAANAGGSLSDAVGIYKEIADSRGGSVFSFTDISADRAGTRFGELASGNSQSANKLQERLSAGLRESDLIPATEDLPEFISESEFKQRFGGIGAPPYKQMMAEIERRIAALPLYR